MVLQLDLFADSAFNRSLLDVTRALADGDLKTAHRSLVDAQAVADTDRSRDAVATLRVLHDWSVRTDWLQGDPRVSEQRLQCECAPLARQWLGPHADAWLRQQRRRLAESMALRPFRGQPDELHAASIWLDLEQPQSARDSVEADWLWRECPEQLYWHARACEQLAEHAQALLDWTLLALNFPAHAEGVLPDSQLLGRSWDDFADLDPPVPTVWFPLWCVLKENLAWPVPELTLREGASQHAWEVLRRAARAPLAERGSVTFRAWLREEAPDLLAGWLRALR